MSFRESMLNRATYTYTILIVVILVCSAPARASVIFDANGNGVSDIWEARYGLSDPVENSDSDQDGRSDREEAVSGTDPWDADSVLGIEIEEPQLDVPFLSWVSRTGKRYRVEGLDSEGHWGAIGDVVPGNGVVVGFADSAEAAGSRWAYRLTVMGEPTYRPEIEDRLKALDSDGDGQDDWTEWRAGTSLVNPSERFQIQSVSIENGVSMTWPTVKGMNYQIEALEDGVWVRGEGVFEGDGARARYTSLAPEGVGLWRLVVDGPDSDGDGLADWEEYLVGLDPKHSNSVGMGRTDQEVVMQDLDLGGVISLETLRPVLNGVEGGEGAVRVRRQGGIAEVTVPLVISGDAVAGVDYEPLPASVTIPFGVNELEIPVRSAYNLPSGSAKQVQISLGSSLDYLLGEVSERSVSLLTGNLINVRDHGAVGDGSTDDTAAIQVAIDVLEGSPEFNGLYFPTGVYRLATLTGSVGSYRLLELGFGGLDGRDIVLRGEPGATLYSDVGTNRSKVLRCSASFRSLSMYDLKVEQSSVPLWPISGSEPNGADGVSVERVGLQPVEQVRFENCEFVNCHRSVSLYGAGYDVRGKCGSAEFIGCRFLNPYGANTLNSMDSWGGGQQVYSTPWVGNALYEGCLFEGGGTTMGDPATSPGGRLKDGSHFGCPLRLVFRNNTVRRMGVEAVFQINSNTFMGGTASSFVVPPTDDTTEAVVIVNSVPSTYVPGESIVIRTPLVPGETPSNSIFTIRGFDPVSRELRITNPGHANSLPVGSLVAKGRTIYLDERWEPSFALIEDNIVEGEIPPGGVAFTGHSGICFTARATVRGNLVTGYALGILSREEVHTPLHPAARGSFVDGNVVVTNDSRVNDAVYTYGIWLRGGGERVHANVIFAPITRKTIGIVLRGDRAFVSGNAVIARELVDNGYGSDQRGVGIGIGNTSQGSRARGNSTSGFDVGIGPAQAHQSPPWYLDSHFSGADVLAVDARGVISE